MVGMQQEDTIHGLGQDGADFTVFTRSIKHHMKEVFGIAQVITRVHKWLANGVFVNHGCQCGHFSDQSMGRNNAVIVVMNIERIVIKSGQGTNNATHNGHRMRVTTETVKKVAQLLMNHGVVLDCADKGFLFCSRWQLAVQ